MILPTLVGPTWRYLPIVTCWAAGEQSQHLISRTNPQVSLRWQNLQKLFDFGSAVLPQHFLWPKALVVFDGLFITTGKKKAEEGEQYCSFPFPFHRLIWEKQSGRVLHAGRAFVFYVTGC